MDSVSLGMKKVFGRLYYKPENQPTVPRGRGQAKTHLPPIDLSEMRAVEKTKQRTSVITSGHRRFDPSSC